MYRTAKNVFISQGKFSSGCITHQLQTICNCLSQSVCCDLKRNSVVVMKLILLL